MDVTIRVVERICHLLDYIQGVPFFGVFILGHPLVDLKNKKLISFQISDV